MTLREIALPMYDISPPATDALAKTLRHYFPQAHFTRPTDLFSHWQDDALLLSQTCGYPLVTMLKKVQVVGCFHYAASGCAGPNYRSLLVTQIDNVSSTLADFRGQIAVCNSHDSQSGYRALLATAGNAHFFSNIIWSGSHRQSLEALQRREADIAAIDCVSFALLTRYQPAKLSGLCVIGETTSTPGLPLITSQKTSSRTLSALRAALGEIARNGSFARPLLIEGFSPLDRSHYVNVARA